MEIPLIHHSGRGLQYYADKYQKLLSKNKIQLSMTENSDPYENAVAEIIKQTIAIYNGVRPHLSNHMLTSN